MKLYSHGSNSVTFEKLQPSGMYLVQLRLAGNVHDKVRCDDYREATTYRKAFIAIAKANK